MYSYIAEDKCLLQETKYHHRIAYISSCVFYSINYSDKFRGVA